MAEEKHIEDDPDVAYLKAKAYTSTARVVEHILEIPEVRRIINRLIRQGIVQGFVMAFLFLGIMVIYNTAKSVIGFDWHIDLLLGIALIAFSATYFIRRSGG